MSSASLLEKRSSKTVRSRQIDSSSSITSAPTSTAASRHKIPSLNRMKEERPCKQRNKSPNRRTRASNFELSSSDVNQSDANQNRLQNAKKTAKCSSATDLQITETVKHPDSALDQLQQELAQASKMR